MDSRRTSEKDRHTADEDALELAVLLYDIHKEQQASE